MSKKAPRTASVEVDKEELAKIGRTADRYAVASPGKDVTAHFMREVAAFVKKALNA